jgi:outer membrane protein assembly factor BamB
MKRKMRGRPDISEMKTYPVTFDTAVALSRRRGLTRRSPAAQAAAKSGRSLLTGLYWVALLGSTQLLGIGTVAAASSAEQNWAQWRGPLQNGVAPQGNPPTEWSETKNVKWKVKIPGEGSATPVIWEEKVFVLTAIPTGKKVEPAPAEAGEQSPRPGAAPQAGADQPGPAGGGPGGRGGFGGFGPGNFLGQRMLAAGDRNDDKKLSREEFTGLADAWFQKFDPEKAGKLDQEKFVDRFGAVMGAPAESASPGGRGGGGGRFIAPGLFGAADSSKDGALTGGEFKDAFAKWFAEWDTDKSGSLNEEKLRAGLNAALPRPQFGGPEAPGRGQGGRGGFGGGPKPTEAHQFAILCLDRQSGKVLWQQVAREEVPHEGYRANEGSFAAPSPVTDGKHVFAYFGSRGLHCYDLNGDLQWSQDFGDMRIANGFGEGSSPALYGNTLIVNWDHEGDDFIVALNKETGKELWRQSRDERTSWSTPLVIEHAGKLQVVVSATGRIRSYDLATGKPIWECAGLTSNVIPSPVAGDGLVYAMSGFRGNALFAIRLGKSGDLTDSDAIVWKQNKATPYVPSPLLYGDKLYFFSSNNGILSCLDTATGKPLFTEERLDAIRGVYASPVGAAGRVYLVGRDGTTLVLKRSDKLEALATNKLDDHIDASPAVVGKELFLRGREYLYCLAEK